MGNLRVAPTAREIGWLEQAIGLATENVAAGGGPFGAIVAREGVVLGLGTNHVVSSHDPTAHAEIVAIRAACRRINDFRLPGCILITSCEPCPMCTAAALWARLGAVVYAADRRDAADAGFDDSRLFQLFTQPRPEWSIVFTQLRLPSALQPFEAWRNNTDRVEY
ncbi:MAG: nucleoside deaminase [Mycobacterium leprae]